MFIKNEKLSRVCKRNERKLFILLVSLYLVATAQAQVFKSVQVNNPGTLSTLLTTTELSTVTDLTITGNIDARDFLVFRYNKMPKLSKLDISSSHIVAFTGSNGPVSNYTTTYPANELPANAFNDTFLPISDVKLPNSLTSIGAKAFFWKGISSIVIPDLVTKIGESAFQVCSALKTVVFGKSVKEIGKNAFSGCILEISAFPASIQSIGEYAFPGLKIDNLVLGDSITKIDKYAFSGCSMTSLTISKSVKSISDGVFSRCSSLQNVTIENGLAYLPNLLFEACPLLSNVTIPPSVKILGSDVFKSCNALTSFSVPTSVHTIGENAFTNCSGLQSITLPSTLKNIGKGAFSYCPKLTTINCHASVPIVVETNKEIFNNVDLSKCTLNVPYLSKSAYLKVYQWKDFPNINESLTGVCLQTSQLNVKDKQNSTTGFTIKSNSVWSVSSSQPWLKIDKTTGANNDSITLTVDVNDSIAGRSALISVIDANNNSQQITVTQEAAVKVLNLVAGNLRAGLSALQKSIIMKLKLTGTMNASDFKVLRDSFPLLTELDLTEVNILAYTGNAGTYVDYSWTYNENEIPINAFYTNYGSVSKTSLKTIKFPKYLTSINGSAFNKCIGLTELYFPKSVKNISCSAFTGCLGLKQITMNNRIPLSTESCGDYYRPFGIVDTTACKLIVPYQTRLSYASATHWKNFRNIEECPYYLFLSSDTLNFTKQTGNTIKYAIQSNVTWNATSNEPWVSFKTNTGSHNDSLIIIAEPNPEYAARTAYVYINSMELEQAYIKIVQDGKDVVINLTPGTLKNVIVSSDKKNITSLTLTGSMDARDFQVLRDSMPKLSILDLSSVKIVAYSGAGGTYYTPSYSYNYPANEIPYSAFFDSYNYVGRPNLSKVTIPKSLRSIGTSAFRKCSGLKLIMFNDTVNTIKDYAFEDCTSLTIGEIPNSITTLGNGIYEGCNNIYLAKYLASLKSTGTNTFRDCIQLKEIVFSNTIETIGESSFQNCKLLSKVDLPITVKTIEKSAFYDCSGLTNVLFSDNINAIGDIAFVNCTGITSISLPNSIKTIGNQSFLRCSNLVDIQLSTSLKTIGKSCFENCSKLTTIQLPESLTYLGEAAFYNTGLKNINIPESITVIQPSTFMGCRSLIDVVLPKTLTRIDYTAFDECRNLPTITIPNSVTFIGSSAFANCSNLKSIICKSTQPILFQNTDHIFNGVDKTNCILNVNYKTKPLYQAALEWKDFKNIVENAQGVFVDSESVYFDAKSEVAKKIKVHSNVNWEIKNTFSWISASKENLNGEESVNISVSENTTLLKREGYIQLSGSDGELYKVRVFQDAALRIINCTAGTLNSKFTILEKRQILYLKLTGTIDARDFKVIRDSLISLQKLDLSEVTIAQYGSFVDLDPDRWGMGYTYYAATIPANSFYYKETLTSVILPNSAIKIEKRCFNGCKKLKSIIIPDLVTRIDAYSFQGCDSLKTITLGKALSYIGNDSFSFCYALSKITVTNPVPVQLLSSNSTFYGVDKLKCQLFIPNNTLNAFKSAVEWKDFLNIYESSTALKSISKSAIKLVTNIGKLRIINAESGKLAQVYTLSGIKIKEQLITSQQTEIILQRGVYIVRVENFAETIFIK